MELDQLRYFTRVAELGNFTRAAEELHVSQSALSRAIQRLEEELGRPVFERKARTVALTDAGTLVYARAQQVLTIIEDTKAELVDDGQSGRLRLGAIPTVAPYFLPGLLQQFSQQLPRATLLVQEETTDHLIKRCQDGDLDLAILAFPIPARHLDVEELFDEELFLVLPPEHALLARQQIRLSDLEPYPFVLLDEAHCLSETITSFCRQRQFHPVAVERTSQLTMVQELVSLSHGISMIPAMARRLDPSDRRVYRSFSGLKPRRTIVAVSNPYRFHSQLFEAFKRHLRAYASQFRQVICAEHPLGG